MMICLSALGIALILLGFGWFSVRQIAFWDQLLRRYDQDLMHYAPRWCSP